MNEKDKKLKRRINNISNALVITTFVLLFMSIWVDGYHIKLFLTSIFVYGIAVFFNYTYKNFEKFNNGEKP